MLTALVRTENEGRIEVLRRVRNDRHLMDYRLVMTITSLWNPLVVWQRLMDDIELEVTPKPT